MVTRLMSRLFSATEERDSELTEQVGNDIEAAKKNGVVDTEELKFEDKGDGKVAITDKENGEVTMAELNQEGQYELYPAEQSEQIEGFIHPEGDGVTPGAQVGAPDEHAEDHMTGEDVIAPNKEDGGLNPEAGHEARVDDSQKPAEDVCPECGKNPCECEKDENKEDEKKFSVSTDNAAVLRIFSDQEFCERIFSEVIATEETAKVGDLKVEKVADEDNAVIVTSESTGDQAKVVINEDDLDVSELDNKEFSEDEDKDEECKNCHDDAAYALRVVGVDADNHVLIDSPVYDEQAANDLVNRLNELGIEGVQVFESDEEAREYAAELLKGLGVESDDDIDEPEEATFSDTDEYTLYTTQFSTNQTYTNKAQTKFFSERENMTDYMVRLFSEEASEEAIESAVAQGIPVATENETIVPIDEATAVIEDKENGEYTLAVVNEDHIEVNPIDEESAKGMMEKKDTPKPEAEDEKKFSGMYCNEAQTKFFSLGEPMTQYMVRLFSDASDQEDIEKAIESGDKVETETEIITPIDEKTVVVEDKENGEFTKAVLDEEDIDVNPISEAEAAELLPAESDVKVEVKEEKKEDSDDDKHEEEDEEKKEDDDEKKEDEKKFSDPMSKFFAEVSGVAVDAPKTVEFIVDENGNPVRPVVAEASSEEATPVEAIEDKALAAVQSIQAAAAEAQAQILNAKSAPVENQEDLQEATFSQKESNSNDIVVSWIKGNMR